MSNIPLHKKYSREFAQPKSADRAIIWRLLDYLRPYAGWAIISILLLIVAKAIEAFVPVYIGTIAQKIINTSSSPEEYKKTVFSWVLSNSFMIVGLLISGYILELMTLVIKSWIGQKAIHTMRVQVYRHILHLYLKYFDKHAVGQLMTRTIHDVDQISQMYTESIIPIIGNIVLVLGMIIGLTFIDWQAALIFLFLIPILVWFTNRFRRLQRQCYDLVRNIMSAMNAFVQEHLMGASIVRNFGIQNREKKTYDEMNEDNRIANLETLHHFAFFISGIDFLQSLSLILLFVFLVSFNPYGTGFQVGVFFTFSLYATMLFRPLVDLADRYNILQSALSAADRVFGVLKVHTEPDDSEELPLNEISSIEFDDVWFAYEDQHWILKGLSFSLQKGESVALVGVTGSGKTSVINLLMRLYDFQKGTIKINGKDIRSYPLHALRKQFSVVLQDPVIFSGTIEENITLFDGKMPKEKIQEAIDLVGLKGLMGRFKSGLQHLLLERGSNLSLGEMQLISLARAIVHPHSVLILDEATANIDTHTEQLIRNALKKVLKQSTALVIAHRLSTIQDSTRIIVLHNGVIAEQGSHQELLAQKGIYEKLYRVQFLP